jgi:predicted component of type VI protein secretion system
MTELTLQWQEGNQLKTQVISDHYPSRQSGVVTLGRDPDRCDIVLQDPSVSGLHVEIFWQQNHFYLRNLRPSNPPHVNQVPLVQGEVPLHQQTKICLGRVELTVVSVGVPVPAAHRDQPAYGIKCPNPTCEHVLPYTAESLQRGCPHCGSSLAAGNTVGPFR